MKGGEYTMLRRIWLSLPSALSRMSQRPLKGKPVLRLRKPTDQLFAPAFLDGGTDFDTLCSCADFAP